MREGVAMRITRQAICAEACRWIGTPYQHQQSLRGIGADCVGLVLGVGRAVGALSATYRLPYYSPQWHLHQRDELLVSHLLHYGLVLSTVIADRQPGDLLVFRLRPDQPCSHLGILIEGTRIVHALSDRSHACVVRQLLHGHRLRELAYICAFPGVVP